ncbi:unnamed protein product [Victoria cruziana]
MRTRGERRRNFLLRGEPSRLRPRDTAQFVMSFSVRQQPDVDSKVYGQREGIVSVWEHISSGKVDLSSSSFCNRITSISDNRTVIFTIFFLICGKGFPSFFSSERVKRRRFLCFDFERNDRHLVENSKKIHFCRLNGIRSRRNLVTSIKTLKERNNFGVRRNERPQKNTSGEGLAAFSQSAEIPEFDL